MKTLLIITTALLVLTVSNLAFANEAAFQAGADQLKLIAKCQPEIQYRDVGMSLTVKTGGIAGLTQVTVKRFFLGNISVENFIVHPIATQNNEEGVTYVGQDIKLAIGYSRSPEGALNGVLQTSRDGEVIEADLVCALVMQNPQVNYNY